MSAAWFIAAAQYINAANTHSRQLNRLYNQLDVDGFLKEYEPHLQQNPKNPNLYMMVRLHLSNAYAAQGRFADAMKLLAATEIREGKKPEQALMSRFAVTSNLCYCAEQMGDLDAAKNTSTSCTATRSSSRRFRRRRSPSSAWPSPAS